jgi:hypothetical protein
MTTTRRSRAPRDHIVAGQWPHAELDGDHAASIAQELSSRLVEAIAARGGNINLISKTAQLNWQTITNLMEGRGWATIATVADLEHALGVELWPRDLQKTHIEASSGRA